MSLRQAIRPSWARVLAREDGVALILALSVSTVLAIAATTAIVSTSSSARTSYRSSASDQAFSAAEGGVAQALAVLYAAISPTTGTLLPGATITIGTASVTYSGTYDSTAKQWTITSIATVPSPAAGAGPVVRKAVRIAYLTDTYAGSTTTKWSRIYTDDTSTCLTLNNVNVAGPIASRGNLCLTGTSQLTGSTVEVGGNTTLASGNNIGTSPASSSPVSTFYTAGTCRYNGGTTNAAPCSSADHVYAKAYSTSPRDLVKPTVDFTYWYNNAAPGPKRPCTGADKVGTPPIFDSDTTYNGTTADQEITPESTNDNPGATGGATGTDKSYQCRVRDASGNVIGEISWNMMTRTLTIKGTVFFDGSAIFHDHNGYVTHYVGRATIYIAGKWHNDETICAGGTGIWPACHTTAAISSWSPETNLMVLVVGDKLGTGNDFSFHTNYSTFQGEIWATHDCSLDDNAMMSGPVICNKLGATNTGGGFYSWPPLGTPLGGQTYGAPVGTGDTSIAAGVQTG